MKVPIILLSFKQLINFGIHIGHYSKDTFFLSSWIFYAWYKNIFVIDLYKTFFGLRSAISIFYRYAKIGRPLWFVCLRSKLGLLVSRYANISGELFNTYWWINGSATNFYRVLGWSRRTSRLMMLKKQEWRCIEKKRLARFFGFVNHRKRLPGACFVPTLINNIAVSDEFSKARLQSVGIVDSNVSSTSLMVPVPGNDDSFVCVNFYCYLLTRAIFAGKIDFVFLWSSQIKQKRQKKELKRFRNLVQFIYLYNNIYKFTNENFFFETFDKVFSTELIFDISVEKSINIWLTGTHLVGGFSGYNKKVFLPEEYEDELSLKLN